MKLSGLRFFVWAASMQAVMPACSGCKDAPPGETQPDAGSPDAVPAEDAAVNLQCPSCVTDRDCAAGSVCAQFAGDTYCAPSCGGGAACASDRACVDLTSAEGAQIQACVPITNVCGLTPGEPDAGTAGAPDAMSPGAMCGVLAGPELASCCSSCRGRTDCQANGCYGGWFCNTQTCHCQRPPDPSTCNGAPDGGPGQPDSGMPADVGPAPVGSVNAAGGSVNRLIFAVVGDTRPATEDDTAGYPTPVITQIWQDLEDENPRPFFAVTTGDYMFADPNGGEGSTQLDLYLGARAHFSNVMFPALGNHECTGATASNCGAEGRSGFTRSYNSYLAKMLAPIGQTNPYYTIRVDATDGSWTSKFVFVAGNAWGPTQATWLENEMSQPTTYTFVVRHEPAVARQAPGVTPSEAIMAQHPYTLLLAGHTHSCFYTADAKELITGNGGAPLSTSVNYGYVIAQQRADGAIEFSAKDYSTKAVFRTFAVWADGSRAP